MICKLQARYGPSTRGRCGLIEIAFVTGLDNHPNLRVSAEDQFFEWWTEMRDWTIELPAWWLP